jgi:F0F1-type ATP synthase assembly protein I
MLNCALVLAIYLVDKYTPAKKMPYILKQIIIGICLALFQVLRQATVLNGSALL